MLGAQALVLHIIEDRLFPLKLRIIRGGGAGGGKGGMMMLLTHFL